MCTRGTDRMITGRWGKPSEVLLDLVVDDDGSVRGVANPGRQNAPIRHGQFDAVSGAVHLEGDYLRPDGTIVPFRVDGRLDGRTLCLTYPFGDMQGAIEVGRVEDYSPPRLTIRDRLKPRIATAQRWFNGRTRPSRTANARTLRERGESLDSIVVRDAIASCSRIGMGDSSDSPGADRTRGSSRVN